MLCCMFLHKWPLGGYDIGSICYPEVSLPQTWHGYSQLAFHVPALIGRLDIFCVALIGGCCWNLRRAPDQEEVVLNSITGNLSKTNSYTVLFLDDLSCH